MSDWPVPFQFVLAVLATWRLSHLVSREDGPFDLIVRARRWAGEGALGHLMDCPHCLGLWVALPLSGWMASTPGDWILLWLATAGGASMAQRVIDGLGPD